MKQILTEFRGVIDTSAITALASLSVTDRRIQQKSISIHLDWPCTRDELVSADGCSAHDGVLFHFLG